jgi:uncharacterized protein (TIGR00661 family)
MRILYGVQATGNGHINRSREVVKELKKRGHEISVIFSGREDGFWGIEDFEPYRIFKGLTFATKNGKINLWKTALNLNFFVFYNDIHILYKTSPEYDLVISDFEPISSRFAKKRNIFCINVSHQACFYYDNIPYRTIDAHATYIIRKFAKGDINIGIHWNRFGNDKIIPPIIPPNLNDRKIPNKYLVYLPFENTGKIVDVFYNFPEYKFFVYTGTKFDDTINSFFMPFSRSGFLNDLEECEGIICNAGFELISEALHMGKKMLVKPVKRQMEQESNAKCIDILELGMTARNIDKKSVGKYLESKTSKKIEWPQTSKLFVDWLEEKNWTDIQSLCNKCWS